MPEVLVIDANNAVHRAWHAIPPMNAPDGRATNAIHGFLIIAARAITKFSPDQVVAAWDRGKPPHRMSLIPGYKSGRKQMAPELWEQMSGLQSLLDRIGMPQLSVDGWEADDVIGSVASANEAAGGTTTILSGDRDMFQLVGGSTVMARPDQKTGGFRVYGPGEVEAEVGLPPELYLDYVALKGDPSDGIPGVRGIGEKGAAALVAEHGSLEAVLAAASGIKGKRGEMLVEDADIARASLLAARIECGLDTGFRPELYWSRPLPEARCHFDELGLRTAWEKMSRSQDAGRRAEPAMLDLFEEPPF